MAEIVQLYDQLSVSETFWLPFVGRKRSNLRGLHVQVWFIIAVMNKLCIMTVPLKCSFRDNFHVKAPFTPSFHLSVSVFWVKGCPSAQQHPDLLG